MPIIVVHGVVYRAYLLISLITCFLKVGRWVRRRAPQVKSLRETLGTTPTVARVERDQS